MRIVKTIIDPFAHKIFPVLPHTANKKNISNVNGHQVHYKISCWSVVGWSRSHDIFRYRNGGLEIPDLLVSCTEIPTYRFTDHLKSSIRVTKFPETPKHRTGWTEKDEMYLVYNNQSNKVDNWVGVDSVCWYGRWAMSPRWQLKSQSPRGVVWRSVDRRQTWIWNIIVEECTYVLC